MLVAGWTSPAEAIHREFPQAVRLTSGNSHVHPPTRSWGHYFAFASDGDLTGEGAQGLQVYVLSMLDYACQLGRPDLRPALEELPDCPSPPRPYLRRVTQASPADAVSNPSVNAQGTVVAFEARGSYQGSFSGTAALRRQVFVRNLVTGVTIPVTGNPDGDSTQPSLNENGGTLTFQSTAAIGGTQSGISQIYLYTVANRELFAVTRAAADSTNPMLNKLGTHVSFQSRADLRNDGSDTRTYQIFWYDRGEERVFQMTDGNAHSTNPYIEEKNPGGVLFQSAATDLPGTAGGPGTQIYRASTKEGELVDVEQLTFGPGNAFQPAIDPNGSRVLFVSNGDHLQNGTTGNRLFALDIRQSIYSVYQLTGKGNINGPISASPGLWFATFAADYDVSGEGACGNQLYIVDYELQHYTVAGKTRLTATRIGERPGEPFPGNPNASCSDNDACTTDTCNAGLTCTHGPMPDGSVCEPGDVCSGFSTCASGDCVAHAALECEDDNLCTDNTCDPVSGCESTAVVCDDNDPCTQNSCDEDLGCVYAPLADMAGLQCQSDQVGGLQVDQFGKKVLKRFRQAHALVSKVNRNKPKGASRKLTKAKRLLEKAAADVAVAPDIPREQINAVLKEVQELLDQMGQILTALRAELAGGSR